MGEVEDETNNSINENLVAGNDLEKNNENEVMTIDELLNYVSYYLSNSCIDKINKMILDFYSPDEILKSKKQLWSICKENLPPYIERKTTINRLSSEANLIDIIEAIKKLDSECCLPVFVTRDIERIPERQPEETNIVCILNRICSVEKLIRDLEDNVILQNNNIKKFEDNILDKLKSVSKVVESNASSELKSDNVGFEVDKTDMIDSETLRRFRKLKIYDDISPEPNVACNDASLGCDDFLNFLDSCDLNDRDSISLTNYQNKISMDKINSDLEYDQILKPPQNFSDKYNDVLKKNSNQMNSSCVNISPKKRDVKFLCKDITKDLPRELVDKDGFTLFESPSTRKRRFNQFKMNNFIGAQKSPVDIWIYKIVEGDLGTIKSYVESEGFRVKSIEQKSNINSKFKSFKLTVSGDDAQILLRPSFWPDGVKCKRWQERRNDRFNVRPVTFVGKRFSNKGF